MAMNKFVEWLEEVANVWENFVDADIPATRIRQSCYKENLSKAKELQEKYPPIAVLAEKKGFFIYEINKLLKIHNIIIENYKSESYKQFSNKNYYKCEEMAREWLEKQEGK